MKESEQHIISEPEAGSINAWTHAPEDFELWQHLPRPRLLRIDSRGDGTRQMDFPPKKRGLVIGLGRQSQIVIGFPKYNSEAYGYHSTSEASVTSAIGHTQIKTLLHGSIQLINGERTVLIHKTPPKDIQKLAQGDTISTLSQIEEGVIRPEEFLSCHGEYIPQRIMQRMCARRLVVHESISSTEIYHILRGGGRHE